MVQGNVQKLLCRLRASSAVTLRVLPRVHQSGAPVLGLTAYVRSARWSCRDGRQHTGSHTCTRMRTHTYTHTHTQRTSASAQEHCLQRRLPAYPTSATLRSPGNHQAPKGTGGRTGGKTHATCHRSPESGPRTPAPCSPQWRPGHQGAGFSLKGRCVSRAGGPQAT